MGGLAAIHANLPYLGLLSKKASYQLCEGLINGCNHGLSMHAKQIPMCQQLGQQPKPTALAGMTCRKHFDAVVARAELRLTEDLCWSGDQYLDGHWLLAVFLHAHLPCCIEQLSASIDSEADCTATS